MGLEGIYWILGMSGHGWPLLDLFGPCDLVVYLAPWFYLGLMPLLNSGLRVIHTYKGNDERQNCELEFDYPSQALSTKSYASVYYPNPPRMNHLHNSRPQALSS